MSVIYINSYRFSTVGGGAPTLFVNEDCEGTGRPFGWTQEGTGSNNWDETGQAASGTQSLSILNHGSATAELYDFAAAPNIYACFKVRYATTPTVNKRTAGFYDASDNKLTSMEVDDQDFELFHGGNVQATTDNSQATGTWYKVWLEREAGAESRLYVVNLTADPTGAKPGTATKITAGTSSESTTRFRLGG